VHWDFSQKNYGKVFETPLKLPVWEESISLILSPLSDQIRPATPAAPTVQVAVWIQGPKR